MIIRLSSILPLLLLAVFSSCLDEDEFSSNDEPRGTLEEYIELNDVTDYTITDSGLYYNVLSEGEDSTTLESVDVIDYYVAFYTMNGDFIFDGFDSNTLWVSSLGTDAFAIEGVKEACLLSNIGDSLSLLVPYELGYGTLGVTDFINPFEDLRVIVKPVNIHLDPLGYLQENNIEDYFSTESGLYYTFENEGEGDLPVAGQTVEVHYTGYLFDGTKFDSSVDRDVTFSFTIGAGRVIAGWDEGKGKLYLPYDLGYGTSGVGDDILPYDNLIFEVEMIDIR